MRDPIATINETLITDATTLFGLIERVSPHDRRHPVARAVMVRCATTPEKVYETMPFGSAWALVAFLLGWHTHRRVDADVLGCAAGLVDGARLADVVELINAVRFGSDFDTTVDELMSDLATLRAHPDWTARAVLTMRAAQVQEPQT